MPGIGFPYSTQSHISCPETNAGRSAVRSTRTSFSPASVSRWRKTSGSATWKLERWRIVREARELGRDGLERADEELQELELGRRAVGDHEHASARLRHPNHLAKRARLVGYEHDFELRPGDVECVVGEIERVAVHHSSSALLRPSSRARATKRSIITGDQSVANTSAPRRAAGRLSRPFLQRRRGTARPTRGLRGVARRSPGRLPAERRTGRSLRRWHPTLPAARYALHSRLTRAGLVLIPVSLRIDFGRR